MAKVNRAVAPYYDDYDSSKQYTQLLAIPGRVAQAREITQIQSTVKDIIKSIGDSILKDGNTIEGCQVIVNSTKTAATVTAGKVYINGMVLPVEEKTIGITGKGTETIGIRLMETIITEEDDNSLRDPAQGYDNYNQAGCHRIRSSVEIVKDDPDSAIITTLVDGAISVEKYAPDYDVMTQTLARRTYDESGSYIVEGLKVRTEEDKSDPNKFTVVVNSGKAYVLGYELRIPAPRRISVNRSMDYITKNIQRSYTATTVLYSGAPYVKQINRVFGLAQATMSLPAPATNTSVSSFGQGVSVSYIISISVPGKDVTFSNDSEVTSTDCSLTTSGIRWNGTANYPTTSFSVVYAYDKVFENGKDYKLDISSTRSHILRWLDTGDAIHPIENSTIQIDYDVYLARKDIVYMDQYGNIDVLLGTPAEYGYEALPNTPVNTLAIASIYSPPNGNSVGESEFLLSTSNIGLTRFTMNDIQKLLNRIRTLEYDQAVLSLNDEARQYETESGSKRGIFTDPLIDFSKLDMYYNLADGVIVEVGLPVYGATIDTLSGICYLPTASGVYDAHYNEGSSTSKKYLRMATLSTKGESVVLSQKNATKSFLINPYTVFPQTPEISIEPAFDNWIDPDHITLPVSREKGSDIVMNTTSEYAEQTITQGLRRPSDTDVSYVDTAIDTKVDPVVYGDYELVQEYSLTYMRQREIDVEGSQFPGNLDNIKCYFDGQLVSLTPTGDTLSGTEAGSVKSNTQGRFTAKFTIPENIPVGTREVRLESDIQREGYANSASILYLGTATKQVWQRTATVLVHTLYNRHYTVITNNYVDPIGQTFVLDKMTIISSINLYFEGKPEGTVPVTCEIRGVENGTITSTVYGHKTLSAKDVNTSSDGSIATKFTFEDPVLLEENKEYAFVVKSSSASYRLWVADLGGTDIITGETVLSNPYLIGVMLSSSNNSSWTTHQTTDIKFELYESVYNNASEVIFDNISVEDVFGKIYLFAESIVPQNTSVDWYYSLDSGVTYSPITPYSTKILNKLETSITLRASLSKAPESNLSPIIVLDSIGAVLSFHHTQGWYISKNITGLDEYTSVDVILDTYIPTDTSLQVYILTEGAGVNLVEAEIVSNSERELNYGWRERTYRVSGLSPSTQCRVFISMKSNYEYLTPSFKRLRMIMS